MLILYVRWHGKSEAYGGTDVIPVIGNPPGAHLFVGRYSVKFEKEEP